MPTPRSFYSFRDGSMPAHLDFIRFEQLEDDLSALAERLGFSIEGIPHLNATKHGHFSEYLTPRSEAAIYERFEYFFEVGKYERHHFNQ